MQQTLKMDTVCFLANCKSIVTCIPYVLHHFRCDLPNFMPKTERY
jgi:hypothetical protein